MRRPQRSHRRCPVAAPPLPRCCPRRPIGQTPHFRTIAVGMSPGSHRGVTGPSPRRSSSFPRTADMASCAVPLSDRLPRMADQRHRSVTERLSGSPPDVAPPSETMPAPPHPRHYLGDACSRGAKIAADVARPALRRTRRANHAPAMYAGCTQDVLSGCGGRPIGGNQRVPTPLE